MRRIAAVAGIVVLCVPGLAAPFQALGSLQIYRTVNRVVANDLGHLGLQPGEVFDYGLVIANGRGAQAQAAFEIDEPLPAGTEYVGPSTLKAWPGSVSGKLARANSQQLFFEVDPLRAGDTVTLFARLRYTGIATSAGAASAVTSASVHPKETPTPPPVPDGKSLIAALSPDKQRAIVGLRLPETARYWLRARNFAGQQVLQKDLGLLSSGESMQVLDVVQLAQGLYILTLERDGQTRPVATFKLAVTR